MESYMQKIWLIRDDINPINMDLIGLFEEFNSENVSQIIFYHACNVLMDMSSITCESVHILSKSEYSNLNSEHIPDTLFNWSWCWLNISINDKIGNFF